MRNKSVTFLSPPPAYICGKETRMADAITDKGKILLNFAANRNSGDNAIRKTHEPYAKRPRNNEMLMATKPMARRTVGKAMPMSEAKKIADLQRQGMSFDEAVAHLRHDKSNPNETKAVANAIPSGYQSEKDIPKNITDEIAEKTLKKAKSRAVNTDDWDRTDLVNHMARILSEEVIEPRLDVSTRTGEQMAKALLSYTGSAFRDIKNASSGALKSDFMEENYVKPLEKYISLAPKYYGDTFRGTTTTDSEMMSLINSYRKGTKIAMHGISSWSREENVAKDFLFANTQGYSGKKNATVFVCKDKQDKGTSVSQFAPSENENQKEILVSRDARYTITDYKERTMTIDGEKTTVHYFYVKSVNN